MRSKRTLALLTATTLAALGACAELASVARGQKDDDWSLTREPSAPAARTRAVPEPSDEVARDRQRRAALADPTDDLTFDQLRSAELTRTGGLAVLTAWLRSEVEGTRGESARLLLARVLASLGQAEEALKLLTEARAQSALGSDARGRASTYPERAARLRALVLRELGRSAEAALELEGATALERRPDQRASLWRAAARDRLRANDAEGAVRALSQAGAASARVGLVAREEQRTLEREAFRRAGKLRELATRLADEGEWARAADVWEELGDEELALGAYRRVAAKTPTDLSTRARLARLLADRGAFEEAERHTRELVRRAPGNLAYVLLLAELLRAEGRRQDALAVLSTFSRGHSVDASGQRALRDLYLRWDEPGLADKEQGGTAARAPSALEPRVVRAEQALARGERAEAVALLSGDRTGPRTAADEAALSALLAERDLLPEALLHSERAVALAPRNLSYLRGRASLLERSGRVGEAEQAFRALLEHPDADRSVRREARQHVVSAWSRAGTLPLHIAELRAQESGSGLDGPATLLLVELYARDPRQLPAQVALLERWLARAPRDLDAWLALTRARRQQGDLRGALSAWSALLETGDPEVIGYAREAVQAALESAHESLAVDLAERARTLAARQPAVQRLVGDFYAARADRARARASYERALELDATDAAARLALVAEAFASEDTARARALLEPLLTSVEDDARSHDAARLLLRRDPEHAERALLEASRGGVHASAMRRLLFEHWAATLLPLAAGTESGTTTEAERERLQKRVLACLGTLFAALASGAPRERDVALGLLDAVVPPAALGPLLAVAEASERSPHERARALRILGKLRASAAAPRLSALYASAPRALRPFTLWALVESGASGAAAALRAELGARSRDQRAFAAVLSIDVTVSATSSALERLHDDDPDAAVRAAAGWALSRSALSSPEHGALDVAGNEGLLALASRAGRDDVAEGLLVADARVRELAAAYLRNERRAHERPPAPRWPFVLDDYLFELARGQAVLDAPLDVPRAQWEGLSRAVAVRLAAERPTVESALRALVPHAGGLVPGALLRAGCAPPGLAVLIYRASESRLAGLVGADDAALSSLALAPLVLGGGADRDEVRTLLERGSTETKLAALTVLAQLQALPTRLRPAVERLARESPHWPTRLWATRALRAEPSPSGGEPMALVRAAAHTEWGAAASSTACEARRPATN